jgi:hypothetical protein
VPLIALLCAACHREPATVHRLNVPVCDDCAVELDAPFVDTGFDRAPPEPAPPHCHGCGNHATDRYHGLPICRSCASEVA